MNHAVEPFKKSPPLPFARQLWGAQLYCSSAVKKKGTISVCLYYTFHVSIGLNHFEISYLVVGLKQKEGIQRIIKKQKENTNKKKSEQYFCECAAFALETSLETIRCESLMRAYLLSEDVCAVMLFHLSCLCGVM